MNEHARIKQLIERIEKLEKKVTALEQWLLRHGEKAAYAGTMLMPRKGSK